MLFVQRVGIYDFRAFAVTRGVSMQTKALALNAGG
jgi:hypothetical protein